MKKIFPGQNILFATLLFALASCRSHYQSPQLTGLAFEKKPLVNAQIQLIDANGKQLHTTTNSTGHYQLSLQGLKAPLLLSVVDGGNATACIKNSTLRPICLASVVATITGDKHQRGNINPLTDRIASDLAISQGFIGPQQWVNSRKVSAINPGKLQIAQHELRNGFGQALQLAGVSDLEHFDPATYPINSTDKIANLLSLIHHNRNYDNNTGETGHTTLTDISFRPIVGLTPNGSYEEFDLIHAQHTIQQITAAKKRIFILGDSTSAVYEKRRFPRMGWGQTFEAQFKSDSGIKVVAGSRSGRSSRDFYNGRWFAQMEPFIKPGDYVFINHGHNDQNCDSGKPIRGAADVSNLCTYPNTTDGQPQFPHADIHLSFQYSLERYIKIARDHGAIPVLFTPTTRIKNSQGQQTTPVVHNHFTRQNAGNGYLFTGDYTQTIKNTASANAIPLIDLEAASIAFANNLGDQGWKKYWLVVDPAINSFYANGVAGSTEAPDGTHFQQKGAEAIAALVAREIKENSELTELAGYLP